MNFSEKNDMPKTKSIELTDARIIKFYEANPRINAEAVNLLFINLIENLLIDTNSVIHSQIMHSINENTNDIKNSLIMLTDTVKSVNTETNLNLFSKIDNIKNDYINELKRIVENNTVDKLTGLLDKNNHVLLDKTSNVLNELVPKSQSHIQSQLNDTLQHFHKSLCIDTSNLVKSADTHTIKDFIQNFEIKTSMMIQTLQQPLYSFITASEERLTMNMNAIKDGNTTNQMTQHKVVSEIEDFLKSFRNNKINTQVFHNNQLSGVLTKMYNSAEINVQPSTTAAMNSGSILLKRLRKPNIIIENKDSMENISVDEINNFMLLIEEHNCNGVFISQNSGISNKKNYQIEIVNNNIVVFLHNVEYCSTKISSAVDIIDNLNTKLRLFKETFKNDDVSIPKEVLESINNEYQLFINQKNAVIEVMKDSQKKVMSQLDELRFPYLDKFLSTKFSLPVQKTGLKCDICKMFNANNLKALAAHKRGCNRKNNAASGIVTNSSVTNSA